MITLSYEKDDKRLRLFIFLFLFISMILSPLSAQAYLAGTGKSSALHYTYKIKHIYPHDPHAYTEGLVFYDGCLIEGTGLLGSSVLKKVKLKTGEIVAEIKLDDVFFGEGIAIGGTRIVQLTYKSGKALVYDLAGFRQTGEFDYAGEGWGLTFDSGFFIMSNGSETLTFLDMETFEEKKSIRVMDGYVPIDMLNELEYINGVIYANVFRSDFIVMIDPATGDVIGRIDLSLLREEKEPCGEVLNGIACDEKNNRIFVTGKLWEHIYEIELDPVVKIDN